MPLLVLAAVLAFASLVASVAGAIALIVTKGHSKHAGKIVFLVAALPLATLFAAGFWLEGIRAHLLAVQAERNPGDKAPMLSTGLLEDSLSGGTAAAVVGAVIVFVAALVIGMFGKFELPRRRALGLAWLSGALVGGGILCSALLAVLRYARGITEVADSIAGLTASNSDKLTLLDARFQESAALLESVRIGVMMLGFGGALVGGLVIFFGARKDDARGSGVGLAGPVIVCALGVVMFALSRGHAADAKQTLPTDQSAVGWPSFEVVVAQECIPAEIAPQIYLTDREAYLDGRDVTLDEFPARLRELSAKIRELYETMGEPVPLDWELHFVAPAALSCSRLAPWVAAAATETYEKSHLITKKDRVTKTRTLGDINRPLACEVPFETIRARCDGRPLKEVLAR